MVIIDIHIKIYLVFCFLAVLIRIETDAVVNKLRCLVVNVEGKREGILGSACGKIALFKHTIHGTVHLKEILAVVCKSELLGRKLKKNV